MDANAKKAALRMIPYGLYVLTAKGKDDAVAAATVNWVTQASFTPPLVVVGVKTDSHAHALIKESKAFALNVLGKGQGPMAFAFFKPATREGQTISGEPFRSGTTGAPILERTPAFVECRLVDSVERGDHSTSSARSWRRPPLSADRGPRRRRHAVAEGAGAQRVLRGVGLGEFGLGRRDSRFRGNVMAAAGSRTEVYPDRGASFSRSPIVAEALSPEPVRTSTVCSCGRMTPLARRRVRPAGATADVGST